MNMQMFAEQVKTHRNPVLNFFPSGQEAARENAPVTTMTLGHFLGGVSVNKNKAKELSAETIRAALAKQR